MSLFTDEEIAKMILLIGEPMTLVSVAVAEMANNLGISENLQPSISQLKESLSHIKI